jgi:NodT family efflux transporter outer membrane factor (OMF) lipoprotein
MNSRVVTLAAIAAATAVLGGCMVGHDYQRPAAEAPAVYKEAGSWKPAQPRDDAVRGRWWEIFRDPQLDTLVEQIQISNQNVQVAEAKFRQARALVQSSRAGLFPTVNGNVAVTRSRSPAGVTGGTTAGRIFTNHSADLEASWEADVWGRLRRTVEASEAGAQASAADLVLALLSAQADLVSNYFQLRILDAQRQLLDDTVAALRKSLELTNNRYVAGVAGKVDLVQAETLLRSTQAQALDTGVQRAQFEHAIAVLLGKPPAEFAIAPAPVAIAMPEIPVGLPSELLERRPDIAGAERRVAAANAQVGVAKAAFFPSLILSSSLGYRSTDLSQWFAAPSRFWSFGPALAQAIFDAGLRRAAEAQAIAAYDASVATYRQTVLAGFQEVEDNLAALRLLEEEADVQELAASAAREAVVLTINQYKAGTVSYLNVVTLQSTQLSNERAAAGILGRRLAASVALIRALGGGWQVPASGGAQ